MKTLRAFVLGLVVVSLLAGVGWLAGGFLPLRLRPSEAWRVFGGLITLLSVGVVLALVACVGVIVEDVLGIGEEHEPSALRTGNPGTGAHVPLPPPTWPRVR